MKHYTKEEIDARRLAYQIKHVPGFAAMSELQQMIDGTVAAYKDQPKELRTALIAIEWRIVDGQGRALQTTGLGECSWVKREHGQVFDGRDNHVLKCKFFSVLMKTPVSVDILPQIVCES